MKINLASVARALADDIDRPVRGANGVLYKNRRPPAPPRPARIEHQRFEIAASMSSVTVRAPAQAVATVPFQPVAERAQLPEVCLTARWVELRAAFAALDDCSPLADDPWTPWLERIAAHVRESEAIEIILMPWCISWTTLRVRSMWTGLPRGDLLTAAQATCCDNRAQVVARADAVAARLRAAGRHVIVTDTTVSAADRRAARPAPEATRTVSVGALQIEVPATSRPVPSSAPMSAPETATDDADDWKPGHRTVRVGTLLIHLPVEMQT